MKPRRVLLVADVRGWAYDIIAKTIAPNFRKYDSEIVYFRELIDGNDSVDTNEFDVIFAFFWHDMFLRGGSLGKVDLNKVCVGVHSHNSWLKRGISVSKTSKILSQYASVGMISRKLFDKFPDIKNRFYTPSGYDPRIFFPRPMPSFEGNLKVCWAGDPGSSHHGDVKGYNDYIFPVIQEMEGVELITASKENPIRHKDMGEFYSQGHVYLCFSSNEGTPLPTLEAMACGRPAISTNVGIAPEVIDKSNGWIIPRRIDSLRGALEECFDSMNSLQKMGVNAYKSVQERVSDWSAMHYEIMFDRVFDSYQERRK